MLQSLAFVFFLHMSVLLGFTFNIHHCRIKLLNFVRLSHLLIGMKRILPFLVLQVSILHAQSGILRYATNMQRYKPTETTNSYSYQLHCIHTPHITTFNNNSLPPSLLTSLDTTSENTTHCTR